MKKRRLRREKRFNFRCLRWLVPLLCALACWLGGVEISAAQRPPQWLSGGSLKHFERHSQMTAQWANQSLRGALDALSQKAAAPRRLAFFLDRRVDPSQSIELSVKDVRFGELLDQLVKSCDLAWCEVDGVYYYGPPAAVSRLPDLLKKQRARIRALSTDRQRALLKRSATKWNELAEPRQIVSQLAKEGGLTVVGLNRAPHDLWPATELPPLTLSDRLTLVLFGLDLTFRLDETGRQLEIVPLDEGPDVEDFQ